jgi:hypothetical protein
LLSQFNADVGEYVRCGVHNANKIVAAMKKLSLGKVFPRLTRDQKINKMGMLANDCGF